MTVARRDLTLTAETHVAVWPGAHVTAHLVHPVTSQRPPSFGGSSIVVAGDRLDLVSVVADEDGVAVLPLPVLDEDFAGYGWALTIGGTATYTIRQISGPREFGKDLIIDTPPGVGLVQVPGPAPAVAAVNTTTLPAGEDATVSIDQDPDTGALTFHFGIPGTED